MRSQHGCTAHQSIGEPQSVLEVAAAAKEEINIGLLRVNHGHLTPPMQPLKIGNMDNVAQVVTTVLETAVTMQLDGGTTVQRCSACSGRSAATESGA